MFNLKKILRALLILALTIALTLAIRRLILAWHLTGVDWSTVFIAFFSYTAVTGIVKIISKLRALSPDDKTDPVRLSEIFDVPRPAIERMLHRTTRKGSL